MSSIEIIPTVPFLTPNTLEIMFVMVESTIPKHANGMEVIVLLKVIPTVTLIDPLGLEMGGVMESTIHQIAVRMEVIACDCD